MSLKIPIDRSHFFSLYNRSFGPISQTQINGLSLLLSFIEADKDLATNHRYVAYLLASIKYETEDTWRPTREHGTPLALLKRYWRNARVRLSLGNLSPEDAILYYRRGFLPVVGRNQYQNFGKLFYLPLLEDPDLVLEPELAYRISSYGLRCGKFTDRPIRLYIGQNLCNYVGARRCVNGNEQSELIAGYAEQIEDMLRTTVTQHDVAC